MSAVALITLASLNLPTLAQAGDATDRLKECAKFQGMERLKCVDDLLGEAAEPTGSASPRARDWIISETTSPVDYRPQIAALTTARVSSQNSPSSLAIHCRAHRTEVIISATGSWKQVPDGG
jgi:hypothetical protein